MTLNPLPKSVRYVKNGRGGQWWPAAKARGEVHLGWSNVPDNLLQAADLAAIEPIIRAAYTGNTGATQDFNALRALLDHPSQHVWVTFEDGCLWWCTVHDAVEINPDDESKNYGNFWLRCDRPWTNCSVGGRYLAMANLPGVITRTAGYRTTVCEPQGWREILRIIQDEQDPDAIAAAQARGAYEDAVVKLIMRLGDRDFELLIDLILSRTGWVRVAKLGGATEGIDVEAENITANEIAFVQVKSSADQRVLNDYVHRYDERRDRYQRMIFAVHSPVGSFKQPTDKSVQVWTGHRIAQLVVRLGLGEWVASRLA
jgi:hypothetical protein